MPHGRSPFHSFDAPAESSGFAAAQCHGKVFLYLHIGGGAAHRILEDSADIFSAFVFWFLDMFTPSISILPESIGYTPAIIFNMVDFPAPFPPMIVTKSPGARCKLIPFKAFSH